MCHLVNGQIDFFLFLLALSFWHPCHHLASSILWLHRHPVILLGATTISLTLFIFSWLLKKVCAKKATSYLDTVVKDLLPDHVALIGGFYYVEQPEVGFGSHVNVVGLEALRAELEWRWNLPLNIVGFQFAVVLAKALLHHKFLNVRVWLPKGKNKNRQLYNMFTPSTLGKAFDPRVKSEIHAFTRSVYR